MQNHDQLLNHSASLNNEFAIEFFGYNITSDGVIRKKIYIKVPYVNKTHYDVKTELNYDQLSILSRALNNSFFSSFYTERYTLFDICFRDSNNLKTIGLNFLDMRDSSYLKPYDALQPFCTFSFETVYKTVISLLNAMFVKTPDYNPISMIGIVMDYEKILSLKLYIRFNQSDYYSPKMREDIIRRIVIGINNKASLLYFVDIARKLESYGFAFYFLGVDFNLDGTRRFKLYFRFLGNQSSKIIKEIVDYLMSKCSLKCSIHNVINEHKNGIWGLALSTCEFKSVNGIQLYLYP